MSEKESVHIMQDKWSIRDVAEALAKHGLIEKQTEQELRDCKTCIHSNKENCAGTEECHECMWDSKYEQQSCDDAISRQAVLDAIDVKAWEFCDYLISKNRNDEQKPVSHFADNLRECVREELPSVNPQPKTGHWIHRKMDNEFWEECSECHAERVYPTLYCPDCGCRMIES